MHLVSVTKNVPKLSTKVIKLFIIFKLVRMICVVRNVKVVRLSVLAAYTGIYGVFLLAIGKRYYE